MDPAGFTDKLDQILCGLAVAVGKPPNPQSAAAISKHMLHKHSIHIHWRTIDAELRKAKEFAKASKRGRQWVLSPLQAGIKRLNGAANDIVLIDPAKAVAATSKLHDALAALSGLIRICDPYLDSKTLLHLDALPPSTTVRFLSFNITDNGTTRSLAQAFGPKGVVLEIRKVRANVLHDRYLIAGQQVLIFGTSLNGFGKKQCFVIRAGLSIAGSLTQTFDSLWGKSIPWP